MLEILRALISRTISTNYKVGVSRVTTAGTYLDEPIANIRVKSLITGLDGPVQPRKGARLSES
jgi:hypothetical protein